MKEKQLTIKGKCLKHYIHIIENMRKLKIKHGLEYYMLKLS